MLVWLLQRLKPKRADAEWSSAAWRETVRVGSYDGAVTLAVRVSPDDQWVETELATVDARELCLAIDAERQRVLSALAEEPIPPAKVHREE